MVRHTTYRGTTIDMDAMRRENETVAAIGNMKVNARGDKITGTTVTQTADDIARANHRVQTAVIHGGLKGELEESPEVAITEQPTAAKVPVKATIKKSREVELPDGSISIEGDA